MTISNFNQLSNKEFKIKDLIHLILFVTILFGGVFIRDLYYKSKLEENKNTIAIIDKKSKEYLGNYRLYFKYRVFKRNIISDDISEQKFFNQLNIGDTILIKYSIEDPSISKVVDFCYMKKHRGKDYCDCEE